CCHRIFLANTLQKRYPSMLLTSAINCMALEKVERMFYYINSPSKLLQGQQSTNP
ncbi:hypothetical protein MKX01_020488, partial [Papaver californicum]